MGWGGGGLFFQAEDGIRDLVRSRGLGDVYKRQILPATSLVMITILTMKYFRPLTATSFSD